MQGFEKIIEHIRNESERECKDIAVKANEESKRIQSVYSQQEQVAYWNCVNNGTKEIEKRFEELSDLAAAQAKKLINQLEQDMLDEVLALTASKLSTLPSRSYNELLNKLGIEQGCKPEYLVEHYRDELEPTVISALFDQRE